MSSLIMLCSKWSASTLIEGRPGIVYVEGLTASDYLGREKPCSVIQFQQTSQPVQPPITRRWVRPTLGSTQEAI
jgi:hypothetical protein